MNSYETSSPRTVISIAAVAMTALTLGLSILPAGKSSDARFQAVASEVSRGDIPAVDVAARDEQPRRPVAAALDHIDADPLARFEDIQLAAPQCRDVNKDVLAAAIGRDEAVTLLVAEPFDRPIERLRGTGGAAGGPG